MVEVAPTKLLTFFFGGNPETGGLPPYTVAWLTLRLAIGDSFCGSLPVKIAIFPGEAFGIEPLAPILLLISVMVLGTLVVKLATPGAFEL
jgi:hypothetical protein